MLLLIIRLLDEQKIDSRTLMDDSAYRGTVGGMFATSLGRLFTFIKTF